jgi:hypothetical protein
MHKRPEALGWKEKLAQRQTILRSLTAVNLQIATITEHVCWIEEQMGRLQGDSPAKRQRPATLLSN